MTSVFALLAGAWLWGIVALGAHATAAQGSASDGGGPSGRVVVSYPAPREPEKVREGLAVGGDVCRPEPRLHSGTTRQPGRGLASSGRVREAVDRVTGEPLSARSSRNAPPTQSGE
jgi:hypothetical protein